MLSVARKTKDVELQRQREIIRAVMSVKGTMKESEVREKEVKEREE